MSGQRLVSFAGGTVEMVERDRDAVELAEFLFSRFAPAIPGAPCLRLELASDGPAMFALWRDGSLVYCKTPAATAATLLLAEAVHGFSVNCREGLLIHAAAVAFDGRGFLLPGPSGTGKSTLAAWLDDQGFACLSDEIIGVSLSGTRLLAFPRPICLEPDAHVVLRDLLERARSDGRLLEAEGSLLVAPRSAVPLASVPLDRLIFPRYVRHAETALHPLSKAAAAIRLMGSVANAGNRADHGFAEIGDLVRRVPAFELCYDDLDGCAKALMRSLEPTPVP